MSWSILVVAVLLEELTALEELVPLDVLAVFDVLVLPDVLAVLAAPAPVETVPMPFA